MPIWKHVMLDLLGIASLLVWPYVLIAAGLLVAYGWVRVRRRWHHPHPARGGRAW